jgi:hypothetical protein
MTTPDDEAELEALRQAAYPNPENADRGEVLMATGVGIGLLGVGFAALSVVCLPCAIGAAPLAAASAPVLLGAGLVKRWNRRRRESAASASSAGETVASPSADEPEKTT